jgi:MoaA/NifB/PqqE/SkfB family radical SAM enzyme
MPDMGTTLHRFDDGSWLRKGLYCPACGSWISRETRESHAPVELPSRLWVYTNYDCNLACRYCLVSSSPYAERRGLRLDQLTRLIAEAVELRIEELFMTGGEPFLLPDIYAMISLATRAMPTTVLTNGMIIRGKRLEQLVQVNGPNLRLQISLDDDRPGVHDLYRGEGSWEKAMEGIRLLRAAGIQLRIATTVTPELEPRVDVVRKFVREELGIAEEHHVVRPLVKRGFAEDGLEVSKDNLVPELTVDVGGIYWHPSGTDADLLVTTDISSLRRALEAVAGLTREKSMFGEQQPFR